MSAGSENTAPEPAAPLPPRPQYGEYATPERQQELMRRGMPAAPPTSAAASAAPVSRAPLTSPTPTTHAARPSRRADRVLTIVLLGYGLFTVVTGIPQFIDYAALVQTTMEVGGIEGEFTNVEQGRLWGLIAALVFAVGWLITAVLSWLQLRAQRLAWWIPLVGAIVTFLFVILCVSIPLLNDPAFFS